jgi:hypothetical protein
VRRGDEGSRVTSLFTSTLLEDPDLWRISTPCLFTRASSSEAYFASHLAVSSSELASRGSPQPPQDPMQDCEHNEKIELLKPLKQCLAYQPWHWRPLSARG